MQKGIKLLEETKEITQFFNRDSSDALQTTADAALTKFIDKPDHVRAILKEWQAAAEKVFHDPGPDDPRPRPAPSRRPSARADPSGAARRRVTREPAVVWLLVAFPLLLEVAWVFWPARRASSSPSPDGAASAPPSRSA